VSSVGANIGVVVIGRNEGERLKACIRSLHTDLLVVYVDSGSADSSVDYVTSQGVDVVVLDMSIPFSAGRARNEGYRYLIDKYPGLDAIQFVDGDCEVCDGWIHQGYARLQQEPKLASVCGRRKERYPDKTLFNGLCDIEWNTPVGPAMATGGDFLCKKAALLAVNGFSPIVVAGEEPEMCFRMRALGWTIERLDNDMTLHDADMHYLSQWWKRSERSGHAYAQGFFLHGQSSERYCRKDLLRIILWACVVPAFIMLSSFFIGIGSFLLLGLYPLKILQVFLSQGRNHGVKLGFAYAASLILGKFPQFQGLLNYLLTRARGKSFQIIEYKVER